MGALSTCGPVKPQIAGATAPAVASPLPGAIAASNSNHLAALAAQERRSAVAAASVEAAKVVNATQPSGQPTTFVDKELTLAAASLPPPDGQATLAAEQRRLATLSTNLSDMTKLYGAAQSEAEKLKAAAVAATAKADAAAAALAHAEKSYAATLERNRAENQAKLDAEKKRADDSEDKAKNERHKLIFRSLLGLGLACIAGAIAMAVLTNGAMLMKSLMLAGGGALCIGVAQVISHPWFDAIAGTCIGLAVVGGLAYLWHERKDALTNEAYRRTVAVLEDTGAVTTREGAQTMLGAELSKALDHSHKALVTGFKREIAVTEAKLAAKAALVGAAR